MNHLVKFRVYQQTIQMTGLRIKVLSEAPRRRVELHDELLGRAQGQLRTFLDLIGPSPLASLSIADAGTSGVRLVEACVAR